MRVTILTSPILLWPPNGKLVPVTISGTIADIGSGVHATTAADAVMDEYGQVQPSGPITLGSDGSYCSRSSSKPLERELTGMAGTTPITVSAEDNAANFGSASSVVTVPHDQGH